MLRTPNGTSSCNYGMYCEVRHFDRSRATIDGLPNQVKDGDRLLRSTNWRWFLIKMVCQGHVRVRRSNIELVASSFGCASQKILPIVCADTFPLTVRRLSCFNLALACRAKKSAWFPPPLGLNRLWSGPELMRQFPRPRPRATPMKVGKWDVASAV